MDLKNWTVLVVEPNKYQGQIILDLLRNAGVDKVKVVTDQGAAGGIASAAGGVRVFDIVTGQVWDAIGWQGNGIQNPGPQSYETAALSQVIGLQRNELYARYASTGGVNGSQGPAYDSNNNSVNWYGGTTWTPPRNSFSAIHPIVSGTPAIGAAVSCNDGLSGGVSAVSFGSPPMALFSLPNVATGTWTVFVSSGLNGREITGVTVSAAGTLWAPNAATTPAWPSAGRYEVYLSSTTDEGYISGTVKNSLSAFKALRSRRSSRR